MAVEPEPKISEKEALELAQKPEGHLSDTTNPFMSDSEKIKVADGEHQSPEWD